MAELRRKLRRGLAGFLALCMTITSFTGISWADEDASYNVLVKLEGAGIWEAAQEAIMNGASVPLDEELDEADTETARFYGLFDGTGNKGSVYEMAVDYEYETGEDEDVPYGADFSVYVRTKKQLTQEEAENYKITGNEQIIFLFYNDSDAVLRYQLHIDDQLTSKVRVNKYEEKLETARPGIEQNQNPGGANGQVPETEAGVIPPVDEEITIPEETTVSEETTAAEAEETTAAPTETPAPSPEETSAQESEDETSVTPEETPEATPEETPAPAPKETENPAEAPAPVPKETQEPIEETPVTTPEKNEAEAPAPVSEETQAPAEELDAAVSMSRNNTVILMSANPESEMEVGTASQLNSIASPSNVSKIKGEIVKRDTFDEDGYNVTVFAANLKDIPKTEPESNYQLLVEHDLAYGGKIYYDEQTIAVSEEAFDENFEYDFSDDVYEGETYHKGGLLLKTPEEDLKVIKDSFVYNEETAKYEAEVIINYELKEGWQVVDDKIEEVKPISYYQRRRVYSDPVVEKQAGIRTVNTSYVFPETLTSVEFASYGPDDIDEPNPPGQSGVPIPPYPMCFDSHEKYVKEEDRFCKNPQAGYEPWFWPQDHHYVSIQSPWGEETTFAGYMRCDLYGKLVDPPIPDVKKRVVTFTLKGESEAFVSLLVYGDNGWKPTFVPDTYTGKNEDYKGRTFSYWYEKGKEDTGENRLSAEDIKSTPIEVKQVDYVGVILPEGNHVYYRNHNEPNKDFIAPFGDKTPIKDDTLYTSANSKAIIKGKNNAYWHDQSNSKPLIGWSETDKENILNNKKQYETFIKENTFYRFGEEVTVDKDLILYPVWGDNSWIKIVINYEIATGQDSWGSVERFHEELYFYETPQGSTAIPVVGYEFVGWYEGKSLKTSNSIINPEARSTTYTAHFKELPLVEITYKAVNGTIVEPVEKNGTHKQWINPVTGNPKGIARPLNDAYEFEYWKDSKGNIIPDTWLTNDKSQNVIKPQKDEVTDRYISETYTAYYKSVNNGSLTIGKELGTSSISLEGIDEEKMPTFRMRVTFRGIGKSDIDIPPGASESKYTNDNKPSNFNPEQDREFNIYLRVGQKATFGKFPRNVHYEVTEDVNSSTYYKSTLEKIDINGETHQNQRAEGNFKSKASQNVVFYNNVDFAVIDDNHPLVIEKKLKAAEPVDNVSFIFKIENIDENSPKYGDIFYTTIHLTNSVRGRAELRLIPVSKAYKVTEESHMRYRCSPEWYRVEVGTGANDGKPKYYVNGAEEESDLNSARFENEKVINGYFSDSYTLVNKMSVEGFNGNAYPGTKDHFPIKTLSLDYQPHAITGLGIDKDKIFENMDNGDNDFKSFVGTTYGL